MLWTEHDRDHLHALWQHHPIAKIAKLLGRSTASVRNAAERYRLRRHKVNGWSDKDVARLKELWPHHSASVIATKLGRSRNAVIGQVNRQRRAGLTFRCQPDRPRPKSKPSRPPRARPSAKVLFMPAKPMPRPIQCPCSLVELEHINCRWPYGNPHEDGFYFCGALVVANKPYCVAHLTIAHAKDFVPHKKRPPTVGGTAAAKNDALSRVAKS